MNDTPYGSRGDEKRSTPHTEQRLTADSETGDDAPEVEEHIPQRRQNLREATRSFDGHVRSAEDDPASHGEDAAS